MVGANILTFDDSNFDSEVLASETPVLVDFWATWCPPCRAIAPHVEAMADQFLGKVRVGKLDVDTSQLMPAKYDIKGIPTLLLFKGGEVVDRIVGGIPRSKLEDFLLKHTS